MTNWTLVEPCAGTAALSMYRLRCSRSLMPYQGSKWSLRRAISSVADDLGYTGIPDRIVLSDLSPIAEVVEEVFSHRTEVLEHLSVLVETGGIFPPLLFHHLQQGACMGPITPRLAAEFLWLQRMNLGAKAVGLTGDRWRCDGLNTTSAYGVEVTDKFGRVKPLGPSMLKSVTDAPSHPNLIGIRGTALPLWEGGRTLVYIDPPYQSTTGYRGASMTRDEVITLALRWHRSGAAVIISEAEPVRIDGWESVMIRKPKRPESKQSMRRATRGQEWLTYATP